MKRLLILIYIFLTFSAIGYSKTLIVYFTWAENTIVKNPNNINVDSIASASVLSPGNTAQIAQHIQNIGGGDIFSIIVTNPYPDNFKECLERVTDERNSNIRPKLKKYLENIDDYDVIFLGYPNWGYTSPMAVFTFLERYDFSGKIIIPFSVHGTGGLAESIDDIRKTVPEAKLLKPLSLTRSDMKNSKEYVEKWLNEIKITK